jgi:NAD(P)-dependent dehydrogenase (short-subunit alcohol dehydrogenase family)
MNISFEDKVALVTGAGSGLGLAVAKAFAESGACLVPDADRWAGLRDTRNLAENNMQNTERRQ